jgi:hypothetical protein
MVTRTATDVLDDLTLLGMATRTKETPGLTSADGVARHALRLSLFPHRTLPAHLISEAAWLRVVVFAPTARS